LADLERAAQDRLGDLVAGEHRREHEAGPRPGRSGTHPRMMLTTIAPTTLSTMIASIGLMSSGPRLGRIARNGRSNGSDTSRRKSRIARDQREYGIRPPKAKNSEETM